jgi:integrase
LKNLDPYIGSRFIDAIHDGTFDKFRKDREADGVSIGSVDRDIGTAARVLEEAARKSRDDGTNLTWRVETPMIEYQREYNKRLPYPLDWEEQKLLFSELAMHLRTMALFDVNTGLRDQELCGLEWAWEQRVPELDTSTIKRSVFLLPGTVTKNGRPRLAIPNDVAQSAPAGRWRESGGPSGPVGARSWSGDDALQLGGGRELGEGRKCR